MHILVCPDILSLSGLMASLNLGFKGCSQALILLRLLLLAQYIECLPLIQ